MVNKKTSVGGKGNKKMETDVILVVKGAGKQDEDVHLNLFLRGFWPAIKSLNPNATISQITDESGDNYSSPHNEKSKLHNHITEIRAKLPTSEDKKNKYIDKRIWIKESYWEYEVLPSTPIGNLTKEWKLSSHVFANMFQDIFFTRDSKRVREIREKIQITDYPEPSLWDYIGNWVSYFILFLLLFTPLGAAAILESYFPDLESSIFVNSIGSFIFPGGLSGAYGSLIFFAIIAAIWAVAPTVEISVMTYFRNDTTLRNLPGLPTWTLILLILLLLSNPLGYFFALVMLIIMQITQVLPRRLLWRYRKYANSDVDWSSYYSYKQITKNGLEKRVGRIQEGWLTRLAFSPLPYRYFIFLVLPVAFVITILAGIFKWTKILGGFGEKMNGFVKFLLVGYLDDVVNYATDPAQAYRVRSVIMNDIKDFHNLGGSRAVQRIHVVAHSQGTPITFEALFHFIEPKYQKKIYTYVTLGSILSYYHQARGILDLIYYKRFQMPIRKDNFPKKFKWMNFWNFTDPTTEYYGLDEYAWFVNKWEKDPQTGESLPKRGYTSPVNIRTRSSLSKNHGEYWDNLDKFQIPFARRVLGDDKPTGWDKDKVCKKKSRWHHMAVLLLSPLTFLFAISISYAVYWLAQNFLFDHFVTIGTDLENTYTALFPPDETTNPSIFPTALSSIKQTWKDFLPLSIIILGVWATFDWLGQLQRAMKVKPDNKETKPD